VEIGETYCYTLVSICSTGESPSSNSSCATVSAFFQINASASPSNGGTITGTGTFEAGTTVTLTATANSGYEFTNWTENGSVVSTNATFSFTASEDRTLVANFNIISYTIAASANPTEGGTINGAGSYNYGSVVILLTTTNQGYEFANWTENGTVVANTPAYTFTATSNRTLMANFNLISYEITAESNPSEGGSISGTGIYNYNETASLTATPNTNYNFLNWTENGTVVSSEATYSFTVTENRALVANFQYFNAINNSNTLSANVYPNPTQNTVIIECENMTEINVFGTTGNLLMTANVSGNSYSLNLNSLTAGTFQVCITTTNGIIVKKIVKE
ncbi:MAG: T9SS type A sorting domain-containing protein, partial [Bacteroidales bacterium]|nr:T9SS type A sorting domain-containing protein [Bacteroidales bacterium]